MIKVECVSCRAPYELEPRRIPERGMKMRCPKCGASFMVSRDGETSAVGANAATPTAAELPPPPADLFAAMAGDATKPVAPPIAPPPPAGAGMLRRATQIGAAVAPPIAAPV